MSDSSEAESRKSDPAQRRSALEAFARALRREAHNLQQRPDLLWPQMYNRLQWEDEPLPGVLAPELDIRSAPGAAPWLRTRTRFRESEALIRTLAGHIGGVRACAISPDSSFIVSAEVPCPGVDYQPLKIWDAATGKERVTLTGHTAAVDACAISPDSSFVVSASNDWTLKIWDAATGKRRATLTSHTSTVSACAISPNGSFIVSGSYDTSLKVWDARTRTMRFTLAAPAGVKSCAISPDSSWILSASWDGTLTIWDAKTGAERATLQGHRGAVRTCTISPDGTFIVSASDDRTLKVWDAKTGAERLTLRGHTNGVKACAVSPDGAFIVSASWDRALKVWEAETGQERATLPFPGGVTSIALHTSRPFAACGDIAGGVYLVELGGIQYGPIVVTAVDFGQGPTVRCPACLQHLPLEEGWLGQEIACSRPGCDGRMRVNPFVTVVRRLPPRRRRWWQFWRHR